MVRKFFTCTLVLIASFGTTAFADSVTSNQVQVYIRPFVSCKASPSNVLISDSVTWTTTVLPTGLAYSYSWSSTGATIVSGNAISSSYNVKYESVGSYSATVTVTPTGITLPSGGSLARTVTCGGSNGVQVNELPGIPTVTPTTPACSATPGKINLGFNQGTGGTITDYYLYRSPANTTLTSSNSIQIQHTTELADLVSPDSGLTAGASYQYQLMARGPGGDRYSTISNSINSSILCFDYSLTNSGNVSVINGQSAPVVIINKQLDAGVTQPVTISLGAVPNGVSGIFTNNPSNPTGTSNLTLTTTLSGTNRTTPGIYLITVNGSPSDATPTDNTTTFNLTVTDPSYPLTVTKSGSGTGVVNSIIPPTSPFISCGSTCSTSFVYNTQVTLTATPDEGSTFVGWSGACTNATGNCVVTMDQAKTVNAIFTQQSASIDTFTATTPVAYNTASTLTWTTSNMSSCSIGVDKTFFGYPKSVAANGTTASPALTQDPTTFTLTCTKNPGTSGNNTATAVVRVLPQVTTPNPQTSAVCGGNITLSYTGGLIGTSYKLYRHIDSDTSPYDFVETATTLGGLRTSDTGLSYNRLYFYQVESINTNGSSYSNRPISTKSSIDCTLGVTLTADKDNGTAPLASILTATPTGTVSGTPSYRFKCDAVNAWSVSQNVNTHSSNYPTQDSSTAWTAATKGGKTATASLPITVSATPNIDLKANGVDAPVTSPLKVANGSNVTLSWTSASLATGNSCTVSWSAVKKPTQNTTGENVTVTATTNIYTITCTTVNGDAVTDSVYVNTAPSQPSVTPTTTTGTNSCGGKITLAYTAGTGATSYSLYRHIDSDTSPYDFVETAATLAGLRTTDTGLISGKTYYYQLMASNANGDAYSERPKSATASLVCVIKPTVDLKISGSDGPVSSPVPVGFYDSPLITWTTTNDPIVPTLCNASGSSEWSGPKPPSDATNPTQSQPLAAQNCTTPRTYSLFCTNSAGTATDNVTVDITGVPPGGFNLFAKPSKGATMTFYGNKASVSINIQVVADDQCSKDAGKDVSFKFTFTDPSDKKVRDATVSSDKTNDTLMTNEFDKGIDVTVKATSPLAPGIYHLSVEGTRNGKKVTVTPPIQVQVIIINPAFNEF